jgi:superfamily II DNA/RNA helicase
VLICTPGRLIDLIENYKLDISNAKFKILDEGDKMLDMGFEKDLMIISKQMNDAKGMIFSATVPQFIQKIAIETFSNPILIDLVGT